MKIYVLWEITESEYGNHKIYTIKGVYKVKSKALADSKCFDKEAEENRQDYIYAVADYNVIE